MTKLLAELQRMANIYGMEFWSYSDQVDIEKDGQNWELEFDADRGCYNITINGDSERVAMFDAQVLALFDEFLFVLNIERIPTTHK